MSPSRSHSNPPSRRRLRDAPVRVLAGLVDRSVRFVLKKIAEDDLLPPSARGTRRT